MGAEMFFCFTERKNISPFVTGGVAGDVSRPITGRFGAPSVDNFNEGAFYVEGRPAKSNITGGASEIRMFVNFNSDRVVPVGLENSPITASIRRWRRVA
jgi:hypothetical protein